MGVGVDKVTEVTPTDAKTYRDHLLAKRYAPTKINRALISLMLFFDTLDGTNPFRKLSMIEIVEPAPVALSKTEWNAVRRSAEAATRRDHGLALALATLFCYAGPRVSEVAALQISDVQVGARRGLLVIRRGKGLKHREIPLVQEVREPLDAYLKHREHLMEERERQTLQIESKRLATSPRRQMMRHPPPLDRACVGCRRVAHYYSACSPVQQPRDTSRVG